MDKLLTQYNHNLNEEGYNINSLKGNDAIYSNIIACVSIGDIMKSLLGPKSRDKLITNRYGEIVVTNDGCTVLKSIQLDHPASKMMVELSQSMDNQNGDGTTSVVVLSSFLLRKSLKLLKGTSLGFAISRGIHPIKIINGFIKACKITLDSIVSQSKSFTIQSPQGIDLMTKVCKTTLNSKLISHTNPILSKYAYYLFLLNNSNNMNNITTNLINIVSIEGGSVEDSLIFPYFIMEHSFITPFYPKQSSLNNHFNIVFLNFSLTKNLNNNSSNIEFILKEEESNIKSIIVLLKKLGISVVGLVQDLNHSQSQFMISNIALSYFNKAKISVLKPFTLDQLLNYSSKLNIPIIVNQNQLKSIKINNENNNSFYKSFRSISYQVINNKSLIHFDNSNNNGYILPTILLRGTTTMELNETERAIHDALCVLRNLIRDPKVVPGGSACEIEASKKILDFCRENNSSKINNEELVAMMAFAESLEEIAETLCYNSGMDNHLEIALQIKNIHINSNNSSDIGIDLKKNKIGDMFDFGVLETLSNKMAQISMATEIVTSILKIDEIIPCT
ncbi:hypothetical protein DICPUDRAFT_43361 [Dictyostelium purpureum]|uniref:Uncharacterized protein n=1 Tax=Dictyostelium purpureum TaxID=5786 RepID=F1A410_DICPU|nr:uncharacterized protein DICPUDRAFT_43361 [Dictyostelium purpureum]EGC29072.1 hypothetical protein DICPUDRAFT_43361 [Dictyostelium purpureum]|eukprot:XP_003294404.1 hypothetical protein DICPUDRAFT_43361 [Dictyostelium purpureum]